MSLVTFSVLVANPKKPPVLTRNDKKKGTITKCTCQKKIEEGHSIERVWYYVLPVAPVAQRYLVTL